ncbi:hypothetical protein NMY22_g12601 [Coprinellus aureogranulatus]|nr:hypothetical protein NMY22_g12601 [Coprinellus aureogranulatus]
MGPRLPNELLQLVIGCLTEQPRADSLPTLLSCCVANSVFKDVCQKHIFASVRLWPHTPSAGTTSSTEDLEYGRKAALLVQALTVNPVLGAHIRVLDYQVMRLPQDKDEDLDETLRALGTMLSVTELTLGLRGICSIRGSSRSVPFQYNITTGEGPGRQWREAVESFIRRPKLVTLRLRRFMVFPFSPFPASLRTVNLQNASFTIWPDLLQPAQIRTQLQTLRCDDADLGGSTQVTNLYALRGGGVELSLSSLETLRVTCDISPSR